MNALNVDEWADLEEDDRNPSAAPAQRSDWHDAADLMRADTPASA